jgi:alpha-ketoglutarate-dependent taurine dioxygenase
MQTPFNLDNEALYQRWRDYKLSHYPLTPEEHIITINNALHPTSDEINTLKQYVKQTNMAFYRLSGDGASNKKHVHTLAKTLGLSQLDHNICADEDDLTSLSVTEHKNQHDYIPYTNKKLSWHTDGYYNLPEKQIHAILLHCATPAMDGGESLVMDHEIAYILLRDENPAYIQALMQHDALSIPPNILNGEIIRDTSIGPVFSTTKAGNLHMRYSARLRNIQWKDNPQIQEACEFLQDLWNNENSPYIIRYTLKAGEGIICNNVLHRRTAFTDAPDTENKRLLFRGRYYDRINHTDTQNIDF